jgi:hypothetical protein
VHSRKPPKTPRSCLSTGDKHTITQFQCRPSRGLVQIERHGGAKKWSQQNRATIDSSITYHDMRKSWERVTWRDVRSKRAIKSRLVRPDGATLHTDCLQSSERHKGRERPAHPAIDGILGNLPSRPMLASVWILVENTDNGP